MPSMDGQCQRMKSPKALGVHNERQMTAIGLLLVSRRPRLQSCDNQHGALGANHGHVLIVPGY